MAVDVGVCGMPDPVGFLALACLALAAHSGGCSLPSRLLGRLSHAPSLPGPLSINSARNLNGSKRCESGRGTSDDACILTANGLGTIPHPTEAAG